MPPSGSWVKSKQTLSIVRCAGLGDYCITRMYYFNDVQLSATLFILVSCLNQQNNKRQAARVRARVALVGT